MAKHEYDDDLFADTRMSFGDHIEELRRRMFNALKGTMFCMLIGFALDGLGSELGIPWIGIGKPVLAMIKKPVEDQMQDFYNSRVWDAKQQTNPPADADEARQRAKEKEAWLVRMREERRDPGIEVVNTPKPLKVTLAADDLDRLKPEPGQKEVHLTVNIPPLELAILLSQATSRIGKTHVLSTLSAQEALMVYFKVSILCGMVLACPVIFWQFWAFVGAGLYPHERKYVQQYLPFSVGLFLLGIVLCQLFVVPGVVKALLGFNEWLGLDPDLRLNEWLGLALIMPIVFGISFQTPMVMFALNRVGIFSTKDYLAYWRHATMFLAVFSAVIMPSPDVVSMMYLFIPMIALYFLGVWLCVLFPAPKRDEDETSLTDAGVAV